MQLEMVNKLYLELSLIATVKTRKELRMEEALKVIAAGECCMNGMGGVLRENLSREEITNIAKQALAN